MKSKNAVPTPTTKPRYNVCAEETSDPDIDDMGGFPSLPKTIRQCPDQRVTFRTRQEMSCHTDYKISNSTVINDVSSVCIVTLIRNAFLCIF